MFSKLLGQFAEFLRKGDLAGRRGCVTDVHVPLASLRYDVLSAAAAEANPPFSEKRRDPGGDEENVHQRLVELLKELH